MRDEMTEKVQELEEELTMALSELKKYQEASKQMSEVWQSLYVFLLVYYFKPLWPLTLHIKYLHCVIVQ